MARLPRSTQEERMQEASLGLVAFLSGVASSSRGPSTAQSVLGSSPHVQIWRLNWGGTRFGNSWDPLGHHKGLTEGHSITENQQDDEHLVSKLKKPDG